MTEPYATPIDHYIADALDEDQAIDQMSELDDTSITQYFSSRDVDDHSPTAGSLGKDVTLRRMSFDRDNPRVQTPVTDGHVAIGTDAIGVELIQGIDEENFRRVCAEAIARVTGRDPATVDWEELMRGGLQTALESQVIVFAVTGVSRACTHQLVRTRKAAYHQQSQRSSWYGPHPEVRVADSVWANPRTREAVLRAIYFAHKAYDTCVDEDISYQDARLILPEGTTNWIMCEYPLRTWLDTYAYRGCQMFQWEIVQVFRKMRELLVDAHPWLEPYAKISCEKTHGALDHKDLTKGGGVEMLAHACTFQGHESVEGQCDFPWARESNRTFQPEESHKIKENK